MVNRLACFALFVVLAAPAHAQSPEAPDADRRQIVPFLGSTYIFRNAPVSDIRFEADIQPNLVVRQNFADKLVIDESLNGTWRKAFSISGSPRVRLRMIEADSAPVRTPSYMPKGTFTGIFFRGESARRVGVWAAMLTVGHHSNGQDGCLFTTDQKVTDSRGKSTCIGQPNLAAINKIDGSFSTNFFTRPATSADLSLRLHSTGHTLEVLDVALTDEEFKEPWVERGVANLLDLFERTQDFPLECGALYHGARGLKLYRERRFGPRESAGAAPGKEAVKSQAPPAEPPSSTDGAR